MLNGNIFFSYQEVINSGFQQRMFLLKRLLSTRKSCVWTVR